MSDVPGPGNYKIGSKVGEGPKFYMGLKLEDSSLVKKAREIPAPD